MTYFPELEPFLHADGTLLDVLEVEAQTLWSPPATSRGPFGMEPSGFERLAALPYAKLVHSVGIAVGGSRLADRRHLPMLRATCEILGAAWCSEHLSFNTFSGRAGESFTGIFLPPRQSPEGV